MTSGTVREQIAYLLSVFDHHGIEAAHITAGCYLSAQVSGFGRAAEAVADVDRIAEHLGLAPDDGDPDSTNYSRHGLVVIGGRTVGVTVYTARPVLTVVAS